MPRLVGKQASNGTSLGLLLIAVAAAYGVLEYSGTVDIIPNVGQPSQTISPMQPYPAQQ
jgi:hypothetical protein